MKKLKAFRGATCAENTSESIAKNVCEMCISLFEKNAIEMNDIVSIQFTMTSDLDAANPASVLRKSQNKFDVSEVAFFCSAEASVKNMFPKTIRVLLTAYADENAKAHYVYMNGAEKLRPEFSCQ